MSKPDNISEDLEQLRPAIIRSVGSTPSERYLAGLAERSFLNLWSYPNPYRGQKLAGGNDGKELCDLLVVCAPHVIVFSEKDISWTEKPTDVAWSRWFRKAVLAAADQLKGAERWINEFPDRIFIDRSCTTPFPLGFPPVEIRRIHRVVVARGAAKPCKTYFNGGLGTLVLRPRLHGTDHCNPASPNFSPFTIGDIDPNGDFVHVFDEAALDIVMSELDTVSDFTQYLDKRAEFLRSGHLEMAYGEEDLLAYYAIRINSDGDHDFTPPEGKTWADVGALFIREGRYFDYVSNEQYRAKKEADKISYAWDRLIEIFTGHMLGGTSIVLDGYPSFSLTNSEIGVRYMALQNRFSRRSHSEAILSAMKIGSTKQAFFRALIAPSTARENETGFFFLTLKYLDRFDAEGGYQKYRQLRTFYLQTYAQSMLMKFPHLERIIGIAMEPPGQGRGSSEDIIYCGQQTWNNDDRRQLQEDCDLLGIMGPLKETPYHGSEFPASRKHSPDVRVKGNRKYRRASAARRRNNR